MEDVLTKIAAAQTVHVAVDRLREEAQAKGAIAATFHISAPHSSQVSRQSYVATFGYDQDWVHAYYDPDIRRHDPIPDAVMRLGRPVTHAELLSHSGWGGEQRAVAERFHGLWQRQTVAMPTYGPFGFDTYASFTLDHVIGPNDVPTIHYIVALTEATNRRIAHLLEGGEAQAISLSARESEVLHWIGMSKSNADIATILHVSPASIDTYVRRLFAKLDVNDRISAAIKGIRLGLIRF